MRHNDPFAWKRFLLSAFSLFWLILLWVSLFHGPVYGPAAVFKPLGDRKSLVVSADPALVRAGVRPGDVIDAGRLSFVDRMHLLEAAKGTPLKLPVVVGDQTRVVVIPAEKPASVEAAVQRWFDGVTLTFSLLLAGYLGYRKPGIMIAALILFIGGGGVSWPALAVPLAGLPDPLYFAVLWPISILASIFPPLVLASFAIRLPGDESVAEKRASIRVVDGLVLLGLVLDALPYSRLIGNAYVAAAGLIVIAACVLSLRYARPSDRGRVGIVFAAVMIGGVGYAISMIIETYTGATTAFFAYATLSVIIVPVSVAYAILRHRVFDIGFVLNRTFAYAITSALVLVVLAALELLAERYVNTLTHVEGIALEFSIALVVIVSARIIHRRIDQLVDRVLFSTRHQQESALRRFATTAQFYTAEEPLIRDTVDALVRFGRVNAAAVYLAKGGDMECAASTFPSAANRIDENDPAYVALRAHREEVDTNEFTTAFPGARLYAMVLAGRLSGILATDERESGEDMPPDIDDAIRRISAAVTIALAAIETDRVRRENTTLRQRLGDIQAV
ncbi:MAG TPA: hypothetical protein VMS32_05445 [Verrucomicrobiae bacterium]|jgi:hypothetical protein|nr:hypothetical protein [Verrucomicrobiae bacterium]